jgi:hypothetical protein
MIDNLSHGVIDPIIEDQFVDHEMRDRPADGIR